MFNVYATEYLDDYLYTKNYITPYCKIYGNESYRYDLYGTKYLEMTYEMNWYYDPEFTVFKERTYETETFVSQ